MFNNKIKILALIFVWMVFYECISLCGNSLNIFIKILLLLTYDVLLILYLFRKGCAEEIGLCRMARGTNILLMLPFLVFPIYNLYLSGFRFAGGGTIFLMLTVCTAEEIFFRGIIPNMFKSKKYGLWLSAVIFGLAHAVNLQQYEVGFVIVQIISAFSAGLAYGALTLKSHSLLPALLFHFMTNVSAGSAEPNIQGLSLCAAVYIGYSMIYLKIFKREKENEILH